VQPRNNYKCGKHQNIKNVQSVTFSVSSRFNDCFGDQNRIVALRRKNLTRSSRPKCDWSVTHIKKILSLKGRWHHTEFQILAAENVNG